MEQDQISVEEEEEDDSSVTRLGDLLNLGNFSKPVAKFFLPKLPTF